ncbi:N-acetylmuramoyl-L-alanine amidase [Bacillus paranthracis]|uniref:N-acetylmuramoyl-L-alanine amidase n=1 Tax=Bacillus paranthracis TaxID=2026186 RepID=UPI003D653D9D
MNVSSHGGHNEIVQGANANGRKEHVMDRQCNAEFINRLRQLGHSVEDDTDNVGRSASAIVGNQVRNINDRYNDVGFSWHLNASNGEGHGVEVLCYSEKEAPVARKISAEIAKRTGWKDRGAKIRPDIGVIRSSNCPFYLVECGFIDNEGDMARWNVGAIVSAVIFAFFGVETSGGSHEKVQTAMIQSGGFGYSEAPAVMQKMAEFGITGQLYVQTDGLCYVKTDRLEDKKIWKLDNYFQDRSWWFTYL